MKADPRLLRPDHLPTPFTADEIRMACQPGRTLRSLVVEPNAAPKVRVTRFVSADADGAEQDSWEETPDGTRLGEPKRRRSTWLGFQQHASFPAATTRRVEEEIEIPAGRFDCLRYTTRDDQAVRTFWFARSVPGMPLRFEERVDGELVYSSTAIENIPAPGSPEGGRILIDPDFTAAIATAFEAFNERRFADFATYMTDDVVETYPQSGERIEGRDRQQAFHEAIPNPPTFTVRNVLRSGDLAVAEVDEQYPDGSVWNDVLIFELRDGRIASMTNYFSQPFPAPDWRRPYRVRP